MIPPYTLPIPRFGEKTRGGLVSEFREMLVSSSGARVHMWQKRELCMWKAQMNGIQSSMRDWVCSVQTSDLFCDDAELSQ
jgi:hypothetical protein